MSLDYFKKDCQTNSNKKKFWINDEPYPTQNPAYIEQNFEKEWIAEVLNPTATECVFFAIDHCVEILKPNNDLDSRCDGVLKFDNKLIFIELKSRQGGNWLKDGRKQLTSTIKRFKQEVNYNQYNKIAGYVCNNLRPRVHSAHFSSIQKFKDDTGFLLTVKNKIDLTTV